MKIKTRLQIVTIFSVATASVIGLILFLTAQRVNKEINKNKITDEIVRGVFELNAITYEYLLHHEERMQAQWQLRHDSLTTLLRETEFKRPEKQVLEDRIQQNHKSLKSLFSQLVKNYERHGSSKKKIALELEERLAGQLLVKSQAMVSDAFQLSMQSHAMIAAAQQRAALFITLFIIFIIAIMAGVSFMFSRSVAKPIRRLHEGAEIIGAGNLNFRVGTTAKDEIGQLSRAFDEMVEKRKWAEDEIKKLNEELEQRIIERTAQLEAANKELEAFAYSVSHDLRAPLRSLTGFGELLKKHSYNALDEKGRHYLEVLEDSARMMAKLIDDILSFSRMGRVEMLMTTVILDRLVKEAVNTLRAETIKRDIIWAINPLPNVCGDASMLQLVMNNLISNALKFTSPARQAKIEIGCLPDEKEAIIYVRDNGVGFDMKYADKLFELFQRLHRTDEFEGTGLGLANVRRIISRHGGRTWAEGKVKEGAVFYFSLPKGKEG